MRRLKSAVVLLPLSVNTPAPFFETLPEPEMSPSAVRLSLRLNTTAALSLMLPESAPLVPPFPI